MQGIVWEMIVSLNESSLGQNPFPYFKDLLDEADILDFPRVSREGTLNEDQRLSTGSLEKTTPTTYSIQKFSKEVNSVYRHYSREDHENRFVLHLNKAKDQIPSSDQLYKGVQNWWEYCSGECFETSTKKHLPLNFIITFFSDLANDLIANPNNEKFSQSLDKLKALKNLVNPKLVAFLRQITPNLEHLETSLILQDQQLRKKSVLQKAKS